MTFEFNNMYIGKSGIVTGKEEYSGKLKKHIDKACENLNGEETYLKSEIKMQKESIKIALKKNKLKEKDINLIIGGDLTEELAATSYAVKGLFSFIGVYSACASFNMGLILSGLMLNENNNLKILVTTSSHNKVSEKEFRNPTEYGAPKKLTSSYTLTAGVTTFVSKKKTKVRVKRGTIGKVLDFNFSDPMNMGASMAPSAVDTLICYLRDTNTKVNDYDLILTGDLGKYASKIFEEVLKKEYKIDIKGKYKDCASMIFEETKKDLYAGTSGPTTSSIVMLTKIYKLMEERRLNKVLLIATGALFSKLSVDQNEKILGISHLIELESVK